MDNQLPPQPPPPVPPPGPPVVPPSSPAAPLLPTPPTPPQSGAPVIPPPSETAPPPATPAAFSNPVVQLPSPPPTPQIETPAAPVEEGEEPPRARTLIGLVVTLVVLLLVAGAVWYFGYYRPGQTSKAVPSPKAGQTPAAGGLPPSRRGGFGLNETPLGVASPTPLPTQTAKALPSL